MPSEAVRRRREAVVAYVAGHPNCTAADVARDVIESGRRDGTLGNPATQALAAHLRGEERRLDEEVSGG